MFGSLLCRMNLRHAWHVENTDDGGRYRRCRRCGKDDDRAVPGSGDWAGPIGMG